MSLAATLGRDLETPAYGDLLKALQKSMETLKTLPLPPALAGLAGVAAQAAAADPAPAGGALVAALQALRGLLPGLADPLAALAPVSGPLELLEAASQQQPPIADQIRGLVDRLEAELRAPGGSDFAGRLARLVAALGSAPEGPALVQLLDNWLQAGGLGGGNGPSLLPLGQLAAGLREALDALGGLMSLETVLADGERLAAIVADRLDAAAVEASLDAVLSLLGDAAAAEPTAAMPLLGEAQAGLDELGRAVATDMAFGEATLLYLDLPRLQVEVKRITAMVSAADTEAIAAALEALAERLAGLAGISLDGIAERSLAQLLDDLDSRSAALAAAIAQTDATLFTAPVRDTVARLRSIRQQVNTAIAQSAVAARAALEELREEVAALPVAAAAEALLGFTTRVRETVAAVETLVAQVETEIAGLADKANLAVSSAGKALATFEEAVAKAFDDADRALEDAKLDTILREVEGNIRTLADKLAAFEMKPYVDAAVEAIDDAATVIEKVPFQLLPASLKDEADAVIGPLREVDAEAALEELEPEWEKIREALDEQVDELQRDYDDLLKKVAEFDPRKRLDELDAALDELAARLRAVSPQVSLEPVAMAVETLRAAVQSVDFASLLDDLQSAFDDVLAKVDAYSADALVRPLRERLDAARARLRAELRIDEWSAALAELARGAEGLLEILDPARAEEEIAAAWEEARRVLDTLPELAAAHGFGTLVTAFLTGSGLRIQPLAFEVVVRWLGGDAGAGPSELGGRTNRLRLAIARARAAVETIDPQAMLTRLLARIEEVRSRLEGTPAGRAAIEELQDVAQRVLGSLVNNRKRYLAALGVAIGTAEILSRIAFGEAAGGVLRLRVAVDPLRVLWRLLLRLLARAGVHGLEEGLGGLLRGALDAVPPARVARILAPLLQAIHGRVRSAIEDVRQELDVGIQELAALIDDISLVPLETALSDLHLETRAELAPLAPNAILGDLSQDLQSLQAKVAALDPLHGVEAALTELRDGTAELLERLDARALLEKPIERWDELVATLSGVDVATLLAPLLESLDGLREETESGFEQAVAAYKRLQAALPAA